MNLEFCNKLRAREVFIGTIVSVDSIAVMEVIASAGLDWIFIEAEHAPITMAALERLLVAAGDTPCLVRLPSHETPWIKRALDLGTAGIIVPQVNTVGEAKAIVEAARFPPQGQRGVGLCRANGYGAILGEYLRNANAGTAVIVQAEHIDVLDNASAIASVDGIDAVFVGPYDLSASMQLAGQLDHREVNDAIEHIRGAFVDVGKPAGYFGATVDDVQTRLVQGFSLVACSADVVLLRNSVKALTTALRTK